MALGMLIATTGAKSQKIVHQNDFETGELSSIRMTKNRSEGALRHITTPHPLRKGRDRISDSAGVQHRHGVGRAGHGA